MGLNQGIGRLLEGIEQWVHLRLIVVEIAPIGSVPVNGIHTFSLWAEEYDLLFQSKDRGRTLSMEKGTCWLRNAHLRESVTLPSSGVRKVSGV